MKDITVSFNGRHTDGSGSSTTDFSDHLMVCCLMLIQIGCEVHTTTIVQNTMVSIFIPQRNVMLVPALLFFLWNMGRINFCCWAFMFQHSQFHPVRWNNIYQPFHRKDNFLRQKTRRRNLSYKILSAKKDEDDNAPGMADAFRQLEALNSLDDPEEYVPAPAKILPITDPPAVTLNSSASPEQDFVLYKDMVQELEANEEATAYSEVLDELGESALQMDDTYSQIMTELGGPTILRPRPKEENSPQRSNRPEGDEVVEVPSGASSSNEQILAEALKEALAEVQLNNPRIREMSLLDDKEIMREIEAVFDAGNAKLLQSLEEVRREQVRVFYDCSASFRDLSAASHPSVFHTQPARLAMDSGSRRNGWHPKPKLNWSMAATMKLVCRMQNKAWNGS